MRHTFKLLTLKRNLKMMLLFLCQYLFLTLKMDKYVAVKTADTELAESKH